MYAVVKKKKSKIQKQFIIRVPESHENNLIFQTAQHTFSLQFQHQHIQYRLDPYIAHQICLPFPSHLNFSANLICEFYLKVFIYQPRPQAIF